MTDSVSRSKDRGLTNENNGALSDQLCTFNFCFLSLLGDRLSRNIMAIHYDPKLWGEDAATFRPERWQEAPREKFAFIPFALGPRACTGRERPGSSKEQIVEPSHGSILRLGRDRSGSMPRHINIVWCAFRKSLEGCVKKVASYISKKLSSGGFRHDAG